MVVQQLVSIIRAALASLMVLAGMAGCVQPAAGNAGGRQITSNVDDWRDQIIYQVVVDRFADGDYSNDYNRDRSAQGRFHGGDWRGLREKIPYFQALGITTLWISPVVKNVEEDAGFGGYHGYWTQDFLSVNPHFGDLGELQDLVDACHLAGINVILDIVTNHIGPLWYYDINRNGQPEDLLFGGGGKSYGSGNNDWPGNFTRASEWDPDFDSRGIQSFSSLGEAGPAPVVWAYQPAINRVPVKPEIFQNPEWYHRNGRVTVWENKPILGQPPCEAPPEDNVELCDYLRKQEMLGDFPGGLKDLATEKPEVRRAMIAVFQHWLEVGDFDGFRIDTVKHVEPGFWKAFCPALRERAAQLGKDKFFIFGEAFTGSDTLLSSYVTEGQFDSLFYFSQKYVVDGVFRDGGPTDSLRILHENRESLYSDQPQPGGVGVAPRDVMVNFLDNHDVERFLNRGTVPALHMALTYIFTSIGVPCMYYGTEQQFDGGNDPANREDMWEGNQAKGLAPYDTSNETFRHIRALSDLRRKYAPLQRGDYRIRWSTASVDDEPDAGLFAYERRLGSDGVLVVLNAKSCSDPSRTSVTKDGDRLMPTLFTAGTVLHDVFPGADQQERITVSADGTVEVRVGCQRAKILVPEGR